MQRVETKLREEIKIQNTVCTADLKQQINLDSFSKHKYLSSDLSLYQCGYVKDDSMVGRVSVFSSGKLISVGTKSPIQAFKELKNSCKILQKYKIAKPVKITPQVRNIVGRINFGQKINIEKLARILPRCMYEPEQFPGLIYTMKDSTVALLFASGKGVIVGVKTIEELNSSYYEVKSRISNN